MSLTMSVFLEFALVILSSTFRLNGVQSRGLTLVLKDGEMDGRAN